MTGRGWEEQHAMRDVPIPAVEVVHACPPGDSGVLPCCGRSPFDVHLTDRITEDPDLVNCQPARRKITTVGYQETAAAVAKLVGATGAHRFALIWTHPEYPTDRPEEPPAGVAVTWTAVACFHGGPKRVARELQIDREQLELIDGRVVAAASCYGLDHGKSIATACSQLMSRLGVNVTFAGGEPARVVDNPREALLEALSG